MAFELIAAASAARRARDPEGPRKGGAAAEAGVFGLLGFHPLLFAAALSVTVYAIVDIEFPRLGLIRADAFDQVLIDLGKSMQ